MAKPSFSLIGAATALLSTSLACAQTLPQVSVTGKATEVAPGLAGFSDPPAKLPMQALSLSAERLDDLGISQLSGITKLDASVSDSYNAVGYWSNLKVRGFDLDNRFNLRRDGLPISGETALSLANKAAVEVLKGSSGIQAGTSAPAGLVNLVVKRPLADDATTLMLGVIERGTVEARVDHSQRFGANREFGLRVNLAAARLDPMLRDTQGHSHTAALATDWRLSPDTLVEAEVEFNRQSQPSQQGFSLLGDRLPDPKRIDPNLNLNNQPWSLPVVFDNTNASLRVQQKLAGEWRAQAALGIQRLRTDDRLAYAFGCTAADGSYYASSFCPDGSYDMYDFRSENEHRDTTSLDISASGPVQLAGLRHDLTVGGLSSRFKSRFQRQAYNYTGSGNIDGSAVTPAAPELTDENTNRDERSNELYLRDRVALTADTTAWLGLRHTRLNRESVRTDGSRPTDYSQSVTTPWIALSHAIASDWLLYASWGEGVESDVVPNRPRYRNRGQALPAMKSRQTEIGLKTGTQRVEGALTVFDIRRPVWRDVLLPGFQACSAQDSCERRIDGYARHRGIEASADLKWSGGGLFASATRLQARRDGSTDASLNGLVPPNVPQTTIKAQLRQDLLPGLQAQLGLRHEGSRFATPDNSIPVAAWTVADAGVRYLHGVGGQTWIWRAAVDNLANRRAWRESPWQYEHSYLYPLAPRTFRASLEVRL
ncbi:TonB-dependent siderophore receptor [Roseateles sp.]|uniref:TonB-dependent siderophore receptor n=1 Tax=Roseateles sp. TaxID=1971397 RepID=UPI0039E85A8C